MFSTTWKLVEMCVVCLTLNVKWMFSKSGVNTEKRREIMGKTRNTFCCCFEANFELTHTLQFFDYLFLNCLTTYNSISIFNSQTKMVFLYLVFRIFFEYIIQKIFRNNWIIVYDHITKKTLLRFYYKSLVAR